MSKKRVLVVDDSPLAREIISSVVNADPDLTVVGTASDGSEAVALTASLKPDVITMDLQMPEMDGYEAIKQIMANNPTPILVVTSSFVRGDQAKAFKSISLGALEVVDKGILNAWDKPALAAEVKEFTSALKFLSDVKVVTHIRGRIEKNKLAERGPAKLTQGKIIGIAASTGGPQALEEIFKKLPADFPVPIIVVQHITPGFEAGLVDWLSTTSKIKIKVAADGESLLPGIIYVAPAGRHLTVSSDEKIKLVDGPAVSGVKPSGTVMFESLAKAYGDRAIGVVLTGMGSDGAVGMKELKEIKGFTIAQNEESSVIFGMPKVAIQLGVVDEVLPLNRIADELIAKAGGG